MNYYSESESEHKHKALRESREHARDFYNSDDFTSRCLGSLHI